MRNTHDEDVTFINGVDVKKAIKIYKKSVYDGEQICKYYKAEEAWYSCYSAFQDSLKNRNMDYEKLAELLGKYLKSWGMNRNSFINDRYDIHIHAIEILMKEDYQDLNNLTCNSFDVNEKRLKNLITELSEYYTYKREIYREKKIKSDISPVLISKVILGTLACTPAYDSIFPKGLKRLDIHPMYFGINSLRSVAEKFKNIHFDEEDRVIAENSKDYKYPDMKLIDMCCWIIGDDKKKTTGANEVVYFLLSGLE